MRIAIIDIIHPILAELLTEAGHECTLVTGLDGKELTPALHGAQGIVVRSTPLKKDLLQQFEELKFIGRVGAGIENIDIQYCHEKGIKVFTSPEGNRDGVGEMCVLMCLALMKHVMRADRQVRSGEWPREENRGSELHGRTIGIIGFGNMGSAFAEKLKGFGVRIIAHDKYKKGFATADVQECSLDRLLSESDVISLHLPLTEETRYFANAAFFDRIERQAYLINTSRGGVVDTDAMLDALDSGILSGAGLDVLEFERENNSSLDHSMLPDVQKRIFASNKVLLTPHTAGVTHEGARKMAVVLANKIINGIVRTPD